MEQDDPVTPDEYVLRRVLNKKDHIDLSLSNPVARAAISPTGNDDRGISVYREEFITPKEVAESGRYESGYYVVRLQVTELEGIGLSVIPDPLDGELLGHALVPELGRIAKNVDKSAYRKLSLKLINLISHENVVFDPNK